MTNVKGFNKLTREQQFYVSNFIKLLSEIYNSVNQPLRNIFKLQNLSEEQLLKLIADIMLKCNIEDTKMNISLSNQKQLIKDLDKKINYLIKSECKNETSILTETLLDVAKQSYNISNYLLLLGTDFNINKISYKKLKQILDKKIKGKNYDDRIWNNRNIIAKKLKVNIREFLSGNISCNDIEREIRNIFKVDKYLSERLIRNEVARVQNEVNEVWFEDNEVEYLLYSATLDRRTCSICASDDGKVFESNDSNRPMLPRHVGDRCTYIALPNKDYRPKFRINNETKIDIEYKDYLEWAKENNL